jgi:small multidrug resistance family-3 protein
MRELLILTTAAALEVAGDALVRWGLRDGKWIGFALGAVVLFAYALIVNTPKWDFGRLLGVYIAVFFVVAQGAAALFYGEKIKLAMLVGGALIAAGGLVMTFWHAEVPA